MFMPVREKAWKRDEYSNPLFNQLIILSMPDLPETNIAVAMSGGVDSTVTAALLQQQGYKVLGFHMDLGLPGLKKQVARVREITSRLDIPLEVIDLSQDFQRDVLTYFRKAYFSGKTPNPCVVCNPAIKFGKLFEAIQKYEMAGMATGHYVRNEKVGTKWQLKKGKDTKKDQSYFLCRVRQEQLPHLIFPLGDLSKEQVYSLAVNLGFHDFEGQESQDICFLQGMNVKQYFSQNLELEPPSKGEIVTLSGEMVGRHQGIFGYTIGQRRGLGIPDSTPFYVVGIQAEKNQVIVGKEEDLWGKHLKINNINWTLGEPPSLPCTYTVKIRYRHEGARAYVAQENDRIQVSFEEPQRAITPGQFAVLYDEDNVVGGGEIA
jgi:tRNA-specific 2-thiouridylase